MIISAESKPATGETYNPKREFSGWVAAGFGSGWLPKAPGTWGSLASLPPAWWLADAVGNEAVLAGAVLLTLLGCIVCSSVLSHLEADDPGWIVIDEWAGQWLTLGMIGLFAGMNGLNLLLGFVAFRAFDIIKPFPIRHIEHMGPAWWAIMADDLMAGLLAGGVVMISYRIWL